MGSVVRQVRGVADGQIGLAAGVSRWKGGLVGGVGRWGW